MGSHLSRLAKPFLLVAPLMALALVPAVLYGRHSGRVAEQADEALVASLTETDDGVALEASALCDPADASSIVTSFVELDIDDETHKASITGLGFDAVTVDVKGRVDEPSGNGTRDDIKIRLDRDGDGWCVVDIQTRTGDG